MYPKDKINKNKRVTKATIIFQWRQNRVLLKEVKTFIDNITQTPEPHVRDNCTTNLQD